MSAAAKVLRYTLVLVHPDTAAPTAVVVGKPVPKWAKDLVHEDDLVSVDTDGGEETVDEVDEKDLAASTVRDLKQYAEGQGFDLADATKKADVIAAIELAIEQRAAGGTSGES